MSDHDQSLDELPEGVEPSTLLGYLAAFALTTVFVMLLLEYLTTSSTRLPIDTWIAYLGFSGGLLMAVDAAGPQRAARLDAFLVQNESRFRWFCNKIIAYFSVVRTPEHSRRGLVSAYIFLAADLALVVVLAKYTLPALGINDWLRWLARIIGPHLNQGFGALLILAFAPILLYPLYRVLGRRGKTVLYYLVRVPWLVVWLFIGWASIGILGLIIVAWALLHVLLFIVRAKIRFELGNLLFLFGTLLFLLSFSLFVFHQIRGAA